MLLASWGSNGSGQLAVGDGDDRAVPSSVIFSDLCDVELVSCGVRHSTAFSMLHHSAGGKFSILRAGELVREEHARDKFVNYHRDFEARVHTISSGWDFDVFVTDRDSLYIAGKNSDVKATSEVTKVGIDSIATACAGLRHAVAVTKSGSVYAWGSNRQGQLGRSGSCSRSTSTLADASVTLTDSVTNGRVELPLMRESLNVRRCAAGEHHTMLLTAEGSLIAFGSNRFGQCACTLECNTEDGRNRASRVVEPHRIDSACFEDSPVIDVACGWSHTFVLTENGSVYSFGRADYGQLGRAHGDQRADPVPKRVYLAHDESAAQEACSSLESSPVKVKQVACGAEHSALVTEDGQLFVCGWNEHGNCGDGSRINVPYFKRVSFSHLEQAGGRRLRVGRVATGGAHIFAFLDLE